MCCVLDLKERCSTLPLICQGTVFWQMLSLQLTLIFWPRCYLGKLFGSSKSIDWITSLTDSTLYNTEVICVAFNNSLVKIKKKKIWFIKEELHPKLKLNMFCSQSHNYQHLFWSKLSEKPQNAINILVGQVVLELFTKTCKILSWSITQEMFSLLRFKCHFWVSQTIFLRMFIIIFQKKCLLFWDSAQNLRNS